jgi:hypothetical protein
VLGLVPSVFDTWTAPSVLSRYDSFGAFVSADRRRAFDLMLDEQLLARHQRRYRIAVVPATAEVYLVAVRWLPTAAAAVLSTPCEPTGPVVVLAIVRSIEGRAHRWARWLAAVKLKRDLSHREAEARLWELAADALAG